MPGDVLRALTAAFHTEQGPALRAFLVKVAWERGDPMAIHLLSEVLDEGTKKFGKQHSMV